MKCPRPEGLPRLLLKSNTLKIPWSTNGQFLLYLEIQSGKKVDTWALAMGGGTEPIAFLQSQFNQNFEVFSPDGKWVAYVSDETGKREVYVTAFVPGGTSRGKWLVSSGGGSQPEWSDGKQLDYLAPDKRIMAVPVSAANGRFWSGAPRALFQSDIIDDFRVHAAGIVHRDLKPANIMVAGDGMVKLLDFGLAKLTEPIETDPLAPTATLNPETEEGTIVGTAAYMSPEQAEGRKVEARSDIFSFGSVLYEMVTGRRAFHGETKMATLSAILHQEPAPLGDCAPPELEKIVTRCLRKDPDWRIQHMDDLKLMLEELKQESSSGGTVRVTPAKKRDLRPLLAAGALAAVLAGVGLWSLYRREPSPMPAAARALTRLTSDPGLTTDPRNW